MALLPLLVFLVLYLGISIVMEDFYKVPVTVAFLISSGVALFTVKGKQLSERIRIFSKGASQENVMLMLWIYILAGAFAASAKSIGCIESTVNMALSVLPGDLIIGGLFLTACFVSLSIGTSVGTVVALVPLAAEVSQKIALMTSFIPQDNVSRMAFFVAVVVGGAYFGDNLSFISDTTVAATKTQGCKMNDKFKSNIRIVLPAAIILLVGYFFLGIGANVYVESLDYNILLVIPYLIVLLFAIIGVDVVIVLSLGCLTTLLVGLISSSADFFAWMGAMGEGVVGMGEMIIVAMLAAGMLEVIRYNGGIEIIISFISNRIKGKKGAEFAISSLVVLVNICTANNTVAIISVGSICKDISNKYGICAKRTASLMDTFSCFTQGLLPYGVQLLLAAGLAGITTIDIIPYLYYPFAIGVASTISILLGKNK